MINLMGAAPGAAGSMGGAAAPGAGMSMPALMAMIQASQGGGGAMGGTGPMTAPPNPFQQAGAPTPMANFIGGGMPAGGGGMQHPGMPPVAPPQQPQGAGAALGGAGTGTADLMKMLAQLRGGQTGVAPGGQQTPGQQVLNNPFGGMAQPPGPPQSNGADLSGAGTNPFAGMTPPAGASPGGQPDPNMMQRLLQHFMSMRQQPPPQMPPMQYPST